MLDEAVFQPEPPVFLRPEQQTNSPNDWFDRSLYHGLFSP